MSNENILQMTKGIISKDPQKRKERFPQMEARLAAHIKAREAEVAKQKEIEANFATLEAIPDDLVLYSGDSFGRFVIFKHWPHEADGGLNDIVFHSESLAEAIREFSKVGGCGVFDTQVGLCQVDIEATKAAMLGAQDE
jgi:hypothetical protein